MVCDIKFSCFSTVTGCSFVVFSAALKSSTQNLQAKTSIVEGTLYKRHWLINRLITWFIIDCSIDWLVNLIAPLIVSVIDWFLNGKLVYRCMHCSIGWSVVWLFTVRLYSFVCVSLALDFVFDERPLNGVLKQFHFDYTWRWHNGSSDVRYHEKDPYSHEGDARSRYTCERGCWGLKRDS